MANAPDLSVMVAGLELKNPVMAGSGEATMTAAGIRAALDAGAGAVVAKSVNESEAARRQLRGATYVLLDEHWNELPWGPAPRGASLFCRSGLVDEPFEPWVEILAGLDREAASRDSYVVASIIVADQAEAVRMARTFEQAGLRWLELNVAPPHGEEATPGAILSVEEPERVAALVRPVRDAIGIPLTVKLSAGGDPVGSAAAAFDAGASAVCLAGRSLGFLPDLRTRRPVLGTFGAVGGAWALPLTLRWIAKARARLGPNANACLIGTNGARDGFDVARFLLAGASAVQMTSAVITDGPEVLTRAVAELTDYLREQGRSARSIIGEAADAVQSYEQATEEIAGRT